MTVSSGAWYRTGKVTLVNGSKSIVGTDTFWLSSLIAVAVGDIFSVDSATWYEVTSVSADGSLELDRNFEGGSAGPINYAIIRNTSGTVLTRIAGQIAVQFNQKQLFLDELRTWLNSVNTTENVTDSHGISTAITTPAQMESEHSSRIAQVDTLVNGISAMTKAEFNALAEKRKADSAGSGFSEWGKHYTNGSANLKINEGLWTDTSSRPNTLLMNRNNDFGDAQGVSRSTTAITNINGVMQSVKESALDALGISLVKFPNAPNGTETYDTSNGNVVQHASAELAFASETTTNKVITSRQDFVFLESWHEKISDKDIVYPLGNVQYGASSYEGITLGTNGIAQGYSAFGEWDTATTGNGAVWSTLSDTNKEKFIQDPENNIYSDGGELIQVRYRVRVVKGLGDNWRTLTTQSNVSLAYADYLEVTVQGSSTTSLNFHNGWNSNNGSFAGKKATDSSGLTRNEGEFHAVKSAGLTNAAHNGLCFAIPIALVQRRNSGAYHPVYNSEGCDYMARVGAPAVADLWYASGAEKPSTTLDCFSLASTNGSYNGAIGGYSGRSDSKFYDAIYASDVSDLRMSSKKLPLSEIREKYKRMAIAGDVRGFEGVPFTIHIIPSSDQPTIDTRLYGVGIDVGVVVGDIVMGVDAGSSQYLTWKGVVVSTAVDQLNIQNHVKRATGYYVVMRPTTHKQANPTWTDIIGSPSNIAATFPDGVEGQWIPQLFNNSASQNFNLNRKLTVDFTNEFYFTDNLGDSWGIANLAPNTTGNYISIGSTTASRVILVAYGTQAHFTSDSDNSKVLDLGSVFANSSPYEYQGNILNSSLVGKISTSNNTDRGTLTGTLLTQVTLNPVTKVLLGGREGYMPKHNIIDLDGTGPAVKTLDYLSHDNNVAKLCYAYKEMVWDMGADNISEAVTRNSGTAYAYSAAGTIYYFNSGLYNGSAYVLEINAGTLTVDTAMYKGDGGHLYSKTSNDLILRQWDGNGFGDSNDFQITNGQNTMTDDNGNSILYGSASFDTQYFIVET